MKCKILILISLIFLVIVLSSSLFQHKAKKPDFKGFGWYGYLADDEINGEVLDRIKSLGGNSVNINVYYEYDTKDENFILLSNLTKLEEKINNSHDYGLTVFLSPFVNLVGGNYTGGAIDEPEQFLTKAKNISIDLAAFAQKNNVEIYAIWNELGLSIHDFQNHTELTNKWLQDVRKEVKKIYNGSITTKEGVQFKFYTKYNFSDFDYIGVTFYPFTTSFTIQPSSGQTFAGVETLEEYEEVIKKEYNTLIELKEKFNSKGVIIGEIGIDVIGDTFIGNDDKSKNIRANAYEIVLKHGEEVIDGFYFGRFEHWDGGSEELDKVFKEYFSK